jgi:hypothetical protein
VDKAYEVYCLADPEFYDSAILAMLEDHPFAIAGREPPIGWRCRRTDDWLMYAPDGLHLPSQGWKIHASTCLDNAEQIAETVWEYCIRERIAFKFIPSRELLFLRNMKYASRAYSGKFVTIFPVDEEQLERVLNELGTALDGQAGRTSSAICAGARARCTYATAVSRSASASAPKASSNRPSRTSTASSSPIVVAPSSRCRPASCCLLASTRT